MEKNPQKGKEMVALAERVLEERGKNNATRNELRKQLEAMDSVIEKQTDRKQMYRDARQEIANRITARNPEEGKSMPMQGLTSLKVCWCKVMDAFEIMAKKSRLPEMKGLRNNPKVHEIALVGRIGEKALETRTRICDIERPGRLTKEETGIIVADAVFDSLLKRTFEQEDKTIQEKFMKDKKTVEVPITIDPVPMPKLGSEKAGQKKTGSKTAGSKTAVRKPKTRSAKGLV